MAAHARVLVAADEATAAGLSRLLERDGFEVVACTSSADSAIDFAVELAPSICLLGMALGNGALQAAREICARVTGVAVVMLAAASSEHDMIDALRAGACGVLPLDTNPERLAATLHGVLAGEAAISRRLAAHLVEEVRAHGRRRRIVLAPGLRPELTSREWEVIELVRRGFSTRDAAERLFVSPVTVRRHVSSVVQKLGVRDREAALELLDAA